MKKGKDTRPRELAATVTYLGMEAKPKAVPPPAPLLKTAILKSENPPVHFYRYLYDTIGQRYFWVERRLWNDDKLRAFLAEEKLALYTLYLGGVPAGMAELDFREPGIGQIAYFGLTPEFTGRRIGPWFLHQTIEICWAEPIKRLLGQHLHPRPQEGARHLSARGLPGLCTGRTDSSSAAGFSGKLSAGS